MVKNFGGKNFGEYKDLKKFGKKNFGKLGPCVIRYVFTQLIV